MRQMEEETEAYKERYIQNEEETAQVKQDMQQIISYKNELEVLIDEQTQNITVSTKRIQSMEDSLRLKDGQID